MALGGGTFTAQNKVLPGAYINVKSTPQSTVSIGERGTVALPIALNWGKTGGVYTITADEFQTNSMAVLGYAYTADEMKPFREIFKHAQKIHVYNLNDNGGDPAACTHATAKYAGTRGNDLKLVIQTNVDDDSKFDVTLYMGTAIVFSQTVATVAELAENAFVTWSDAALEVTAGLPFTGATNGTTVDMSYQNALDKFESYRFDVLVCPDSEKVGTLYVEYTKRLRDTRGIKFQTVVTGVAADYWGVVNLNPTQADAIYWVAGYLAGCAVNASLTNKLYDGECTIPCNETQSELENYIMDGVFAFHTVDDEVRVLMDINSFVTFTDDNGAIFAKNQVVRVTDNRHNDIQRVFNKKYLGNIQNDADGRTSFWGDMVKLSEAYAAMRAIEPYNSKSLTVNIGDTPESVVVRDYIVVIGTMEKLYMETICN